MSAPVDRLVLLDSEPLGLATNPRASVKATRCKKWLRDLLAGGVRVMIPEVIDYEIRRELLRARRSRGIAALDALGLQLGLLPCSGGVLTEAAALWADARQKGHPTADDKALDIDVILAATANLASLAGFDVVIATGNVAHLSLFATAQLWEQITA